MQIYPYFHQTTFFRYIVLDRQRMRMIYPSLTMCVALLILTNHLAQFGEFISELQLLNLPITNNLSPELSFNRPIIFYLDGNKQKENFGNLSNIFWSYTDHCPGQFLGLGFRKLWKQKAQVFKNIQFEGPDIAVDMKVDRARPEACCLHRHEGDVDLLVVDMKHCSPITAHTGLGFKKFRQVQCNREYTGRDVVK